MKLTRKQAHKVIDRMNVCDETKEVLKKEWEISASIRFCICGTLARQINSGMGMVD